MQPIQQGSTETAETGIGFVSVDVNNLSTRLSGTLAFTARIVRPNGTVITGTGTFATVSAAAAPGVRRYYPSAADLETAGVNVVVITATGMEPREIPIVVTPGDPYGDPGQRLATAFAGVYRDTNSTIERSIPFTAVSNTNPQTRLNASSLTWSVTIVRADGTTATGLGSIVQPSFALAPGVAYYVAAKEDVVQVGQTILRLAATGAETREVEFFVLPWDPYRTLPLTGVTWQSLIDRARVYIADDHDDRKGFLTIDKWMALANVEYQSLRRHWTRMGLVRPPLVTTTFTGPTVTLSGVEAIAGVAQPNWGQYPRELKYERVLWGTTQTSQACTWCAEGTGGDVTISVYPQDTAEYQVKWVQAIPVATDPESLVELPHGGDERLVLGLAKRALVKDSSRSAPLEELIAQQDIQISFNAINQVRSARSHGPRTTGIVPMYEPSKWLYY